MKCSIHVRVHEKRKACVFGGQERFTKAMKLELDVERWVGFGEMGKRVLGKGPDTQHDMAHSEPVGRAGPEGLENEMFT